MAPTTLHAARMPDMGLAAERWAIVVPVKRLSGAKTRLRLDPDVRIELALAMAADTVRAALACPVTDLVIAVSDDEQAAPVLKSLGAVVRGWTAADRHTFARLLARFVDGLAVRGR